MDFRTSSARCSCGLTSFMAKNTNGGLSANYPNPFNPTTIIPYELPAAGHVTLEVFDMLGRRLALLVDEAVSAGRHEVRFDAGNLSSGVYLYRLQTGDVVQTRQMVLVK